MTATYTIYLVIAAWKDMRYKKIPIWLYLIFGAAGIIENCMRTDFLWSELVWWKILATMLPGITLLVITKCSRGAIGSGDGLFFLVTAVYLGFWSTLRLLLCGLIFCSTCCLGIVVWGVVTGVDVRKMRLPFLPFLLPAWIWMRL